MGFVVERDLGATGERVCCTDYPQEGDSRKD